MAKISAAESKNHKLLNPISEKLQNKKCFSKHGTLVLSAVKVSSLILLYYIFSIGLLFYNKWLFERLQFPLITTTVHLMLKFIFAWFIRMMLSVVTGKRRVVLDWKTYILKVVPAGITAGLDIALSNWSLLIVTVSLYSMTKSTCIIFLLLFSILLKLQKPTVVLVLIILTIAGGLFLFTFKLTQFNMFGFVLVLMASLLCGMRWAITQYILQVKELGLNNPLDTMYHVQPAMLLVIFLLSVCFEGLSVSISTSMFGYHDVKSIITSVSMLLVGAMVAFVLEISEYLLVSHTSGLTLSVSSIPKEMVTLYIATQYGGDELTTINKVGMVICLIGITIHVIIKAVNANGKSEQMYESSDVRNRDDLEMLVQNKEGDSDEDDILFSIETINNRNS